MKPVPRRKSCLAMSTLLRGEAGRERGGEEGMTGVTAVGARVSD